MAVTLERGDLVWLNFSPQKGSEQAGHRPAIIISPKPYNQVSRCVLACPITSNLAPWPWKVELSSSKSINGAVLADQVRTIDVEARGVRKSGERATDKEIAEVLAKLKTLVEYGHDQ